jgi:hypothetical protein
VKLNITFRKGEREERIQFSESATDDRAGTACATVTSLTNIDERDEGTYARRAHFWNYDEWNRSQPNGKRPRKAK